MNHPLRFDPRQAVRQLVLVGCGGTGSQWARSIARILYDMRRRGLQIPDVLLVDPDVVEEANVGRQLFAPADVGQSKAEVLARRFNRALGLQMAWAVEPFDPARDVGRYGTLLCGAVDNHLARHALAQAGGLWIDAGNHHASGQVVVGNSDNRDEVLGALERLPDNGLLSVLPNAALLFPELLEPEAALEQPDASCAELVESGQQHLLVNDAIATVAAQATYSLLHRQPLSAGLTYLALGDALTVRPVPITAETLRASLAPAEGA